MTQITVADLDNAKLDVNTIADIANDTGVSVIDRLGATRLTVNEAVRRMGYQVPVTYASSIVISTLTQTVDYLGVVYAPLPTMIPFTTSGTFETTKFYVIQNNEIVKKYNTYADLLASGGAILDGTRADMSGYYAIGDGGANSFVYSTASTATHNGGTVIKPTSVSGAGRWLAVFSNYIDLRWFGAKSGTGVNTAPEIQAAFTAASAAGVSVVDRGGSYTIASTIDTLGVNFTGSASKTVFIPTITNGTPVFSAASAANVQFQTLKDFSIISGINSANYLTGAVTAQNCTGLKLGSGSYYCNRFLLQNIHVFGVATAVYCRGYIGTAVNVFSDYCDLGWDGIENNGCNLDLKFENCNKDYSFVTSNGMRLNILAEGGKTTVVSSTMDNCEGVDVTLYTETGVATPRNNPYLTIGATTECRTINILGSVTGYVAYNVYPLSVDKCVGININCAFSTSSQNTSVLTTANTKNYKLNGKQRLASRLLQDASKQIGTAFNYWPNRSFELWLRGYNDVIPANAVITQETTNVRRGKNALRVTANAGITSCNAGFKITGDLPIYLRGKSMKIGVWVYIPAITNYDESLSMGSRALPNMVLASFNGTTLTTVAAKNDGFKSGAWNFVESYDLTMQVDCTQIFVYLYANNSSFVTNGTEYIIVDSIVLTESTTPYTRLQDDDLIDSPQCPMIAIGGKMIYKATAAPTDTDQVFEQGDRVEFTNPTSAGYIGTVCTVGGSVGTWKNYGLIT